MQKSTIDTEQIKMWFERAKKNLFISLFSCAMLIRFILSLVFIFSYIERFINHSGGTWFVYSLGVVLMILPFVVEFSIGLVSFATSLVKNVLGYWILAFVAITISGLAYNAYHIQEFRGMIKDEDLSGFVGIILHFSNFLSFVLIELMGFLVMQVEGFSSSSSPFSSVSSTSTVLNAPKSELSTSIIKDNEETWKQVFQMIEHQGLSFQKASEMLGVAKGTVYSRYQKHLVSNKPEKQAMDMGHHMFG